MEALGIPGGPIANGYGYPYYPACSLSGSQQAAGSTYVAAVAAAQVAAALAVVVVVVVAAAAAAAAVVVAFAGVQAAPAATAWAAPCTHPGAATPNKA